MNQFLILIDGPMASGKTTLGKLLHKKLARTAMISMDTIKWFVSDFKRDKHDNAVASKMVQKMTEEYLKNKLNVIIPQAFWKKENIDPYLKIAKDNHVKIFIYQLMASPEVLNDRLSKREKPPEAPTPITQEQIENNFKTWKENQYGLGKVFDTTVLSAEDIAGEILKEIEG